MDYQLRHERFPGTYIIIFEKRCTTKHFLTAFKCGRRVHFALQRKMLLPPIAHLPEIKLDFINRPSGEKDCIYEAIVGTALTNFNPGQFKTWMKKMAAHVNFCLFLNVFGCLACNMVPENKHICVNKGRTYLLIVNYCQLNFTNFPIFDQSALEYEHI